MFGKKGVRKITPDERTFALCFARTMSVRQSCAAAGFERRTSFARASRLLERGDVRSLVRASILGESSDVFPAGSAAPAPGGSADEAPDAAIAPVSLEIVRDAPDESGAATPESGVHAPESGVHAPESGVHAPESGVHAPESGVHAPESGVHPPESGVRPPESGDPTSECGEKAAKREESECATEVPSPTVTKASDTGVPAPSAGEETDGGDLAFDLIERRILSEYEKIAFAPATKESDVKIADKLRALDQYRSIVERQAQRIADAASAGRLSADRLTVVYDYGDEREPR